MNRAEAISQKLLLAGEIPILTQEYIEQKKSDGRFLASVWNLFSFRGLTKTIEAARKEKPSVPGEIHGDIPLGDKVFKATGKLYAEHLCSDSSAGYLSGRKRTFVVGMFEIDEDAQSIEISPIIIGELVDHVKGSSFDFNRWPTRSRIYPQEIDCFNKIDEVRPPTGDQLLALSSFSEAATKSAFAKIIGEAFIPKDWGGEKSDLYTSQLTVSGKPMSAAFLLKGPAIFHPMHPSDLGKRGDQIVRLFEEPADILFLQHCHQIMPTVIRQMEAFAVNPHKPRFFCIIDGQETYRILKAYDFLP